MNVTRKTRNPARKHVFFCIDFIEEGDIKRFKINNENVVKISKAGRNEATIQLNTLPIYVKNISDWSLPNQDYENYKWKCMIANHFYRITSMIHIMVLVLIKIIYF